MDLDALTNVNAIMMPLVITYLVFVSAHRAGEVASVTKDAQWDFLDKIARVSAVVLTEQFAITSQENVDVHQVTPEKGMQIRVKSGIFGQTAKFGKPPCLFHSSVTGIKNKLTKQTVKILMRRLMRSRLIWISTVCKCVSEFT